MKHQTFFYTYLASMLGTAIIAFILVWYSITDTASLRNALWGSGPCALLGAVSLHLIFRPFEGPDPLPAIYRHMLIFAMVFYGIASGSLAAASGLSEMPKHQQGGLVLSVFSLYLAGFLWLTLKQRHRRTKIT